MLGSSVRKVWTKEGCYSRLAGDLVSFADVGKATDGMDKGGYGRAYLGDESYRTSTLSWKPRAECHGSEARDLTV